jgi:hypothetical protein
MFNLLSEGKLNLLFQADHQLRTDMKAEWMYDMAYNTIFLIWKYVYDGKMAVQDAPEFVVSTFLHGFRTQ